MPSSGRRFPIFHRSADRRSRKLVYRSNRPFSNAVNDSRTVRGVFLLALGGALGLSGCADESNVTSVKFAPACPTVNVPGAAADRIVYDGKGLDIGHLISQAQIVSVQGDCNNGTEDASHRPFTRVRISINLHLERGPAATANEITIPYFFAIVRNGEIVDKKIFETTLPLEARHSSQEFNTPLRLLDVPSGGNAHYSPYTLEVGFQLTRQQLDYNFSHLLPAKFEDSAPESH